MCDLLVTCYFDERCEMCALTRYVGFDSVHSWTLWFGSRSLVSPCWFWFLIEIVGCVGVRCTLLLFCLLIAILLLVAPFRLVLSVLPLLVFGCYPQLGQVAQAPLFSSRL